MNGRAEVARLKQRLDATFDRVQGVGPDLELRSDFARYLCVLVAGYLEKAVAELLLQHARASGTPTLQRFVERGTRRFTNPNAEKLKALLGSFDAAWQSDLESFLVDEVKAAVDSVVALRNQVSHGGSVAVTYQRIAEYYARVQKVVERIADICAPA